ncbi:MAG TPA: RNA-binding protein [Anaerolineae bacterium]|nr:RNA-binding protein [Anaerolineae bacterium]HXV96999.1 RNA-binding protein [Anaerolineae bacterium]
MNIYVGNLAWAVTDDDLRQAFEGYGEVTSASIIKDKFTGQSRGFGFVEMPNSAEAQAAITALDNQDLKGRAIKVNEARPVERREGGGGGGRGPRGGGSRGGGDRDRGGRGGGGGGDRGFRSDRGGGRR